MPNVYGVNSWVNQYVSFADGSNLTKAQKAKVKENDLDIEEQEFFGLSMIP